jgi:hypothetical protein
LPRNSINNGFNGLWLIFLLSVAGVIEVLNSSFYIISHRVSFRKWVNVGNIVSFHCSLLKQVSIVVSTVLKNFMPSALLLDIQELSRRVHTGASNAAVLENLTRETQLVVVAATILSTLAMNMSMKKK